MKDSYFCADDEFIGGALPGMFNYPARTQGIVCLGNHLWTAFRMHQHFSFRMLILQSNNVIHPDFHMGWAISWPEDKLFPGF